jgi:hypothetical protein
MTIPELACSLAADPAGSGRLATYRLVRNLCASVLASGQTPAPGLLLGAAKVRPSANGGDLEKIPVAGPVLVAAGAAYGALEALAASVLLDEIRPDVKVVADQFVATAPNLRPRFIACDPWEDRRAALVNVRALREGLAWLRCGGLLAAFLAEEGWGAAVRLARRAGAAIVPAAVAWRQTGLPEGGAVEMRFGAPLASERLAEFALDAHATAYLRWRVNLLACRHEPALRLVPRLATGAAPGARNGSWRSACP